MKYINKIQEKEALVLLAIVLLGSFLRFYKLGIVPPGLYFDETVYGLDAYSILKTGRDIYGHFLPPTFQSSGYYPPLYIYFLAPFLAFFDLSAMSVRFPNALASATGIFIIYFFTKTIFGKKYPYAPIIASIIFALNPWIIHISRVAYLNGFGLVFLIAGSYFLINSYRNRTYFILASVTFALTTLIHFGYKLIAPSLFFLLLILLKNKLKLNKNGYIVLFIVWIATLFINIISYTNFNAGFRVNELRLNDPVKIITEYYKTFSVQFLFLEGDNSIYKTPWKDGKIQFIFLPVLILGIWRSLLIKK